MMNNLHTRSEIKEYIVMCIVKIENHSYKDKLFKNMKYFFPVPSNPVKQEKIIKLL